MKRMVGWLVLLAASSSVLAAAPRPHVVSLGKWTTVKWMVGEDESQAVDLRIRPLTIDGRVKEFLVGATHDVTERTFVAQRAYRLNDSLPQDSGIRWRWERGGWLLVDRVSGKVQAITLPEFDPYYSAVAWFRDYAAYCGVSDDGTKGYAIVSQLGKRRPVLKKFVAEVSGADMSDSECPAPIWQRAPWRVTFEPSKGPKTTYSVRGRAIDLVPEDDEAGE